MKLVQPHFCQHFVAYTGKRQILDLYQIDLNNQGQNTTVFSHNKPDKKSLKAYH